MIKAVFLDRDGTLLDEPKSEIVNTWGTFKIKNDIHCLSGLPRAGYTLFIVLNQEGINEGVLSRKFYNETNERLCSVLHRGSVDIEKIYTCPHSHLENCGCRKPNSGLIEQAVRDYQIIRDESWVIGDRLTDVALARASGIRSILISSGFHTIGEISPDFIAPDLCTAVAHITKRA